MGERPLLRDPLVDEAVRRDGFAVIDLFSPAEIDALRAADRELGHEITTDRSFARGFHATIIDDRVDYRTRSFEAARDICAGPFSDRFIDLDLVMVNWLQKEPGADAVPFHVDWTFVDEHQHRSLSVWAPLVDTDETTGAVGVVGGSHETVTFIRAAAHPTYQETDAFGRSLPGQQVVPLRAGQALVFDHRLVHFSMPHHGDAPRVALSCELVPAEAELLHFEQLAPHRFRRHVVDRTFFTTYAAGQDPTQVDGHESFADVDGQSFVPLPSPVPAAVDDPERARIPVIPLYKWAKVHEDLAADLVEPCLSIGMLFAYARHVDGGRLNERYDLQRLEPNAERVLERWAEDPVPAIFVFSDYMWNIDMHLELSERVKEISPESICMHGGPSCPKYDPDRDEFFVAHPSVDVAAVGEGEFTFVEALTRLDGRLDPGAIDRLEGVEGLSYRASDGTIVRNADRERPADLDIFPSPYLTGEFDALLTQRWKAASVESNRGCPYGCTFCDWGSATLSRIRKFDIDRVRAEFTWIMEHAAPTTLMINDANFGIFSRDVDITRHIASLKAAHPEFNLFIFSGLAKNTTKYTSEIMSIMVDAGIHTMAASLAIQTTDPQTLQIVRRQNIKLEKYDELAETFLEQGLPRMTDLLVGLPGATAASFAQDLQHCFDRDITARMFLTLLLPNSPMNEPSYGAEHQIEVNEFDVVIRSSSFDDREYARMKRLRVLFRGADHFGVLRLVLRYLQWDRGILAMDVLQRLDDFLDEPSNHYPLLSFFGRAFDLYTIPPVGWRPFFDEFRAWLDATFEIGDDPILDGVVDAQIALLPAIGRSFPAKVELEHDVVNWVFDHRARVDPPRKLADYGPAVLEIDDPERVCEFRIIRNDFPLRREMESGNLYWVGLDWELDSPLARHLYSIDPNRRVPVKT